MTDHGYTLESHVADSGRLAERAALRLLVALASEAEAAFENGGLRDGLVAADVVMDGEPEAVRVVEALAATDPRRLAAAAPESGVGDGKANERTVVFALGLIAFHALSGAPAFRTPGESARRAAPVYDLRAHRVSEPTIELLRRATAREPGSRPKRVKKLRRAAEKILARTRWDGDRVARRERRASVALPAIAIVALAGTVALFYFRVGPFRFERVTDGFARLFSERSDAPPSRDSGAGPAPLGPAADSATATPTDGEASGADKGAAAAVPPVTEDAPPPRDDSEDFLFPRQPSSADTALYKQAMDKLEAARSRIETSALDSGEKKFTALREAMGWLEEARSLLERYAETHPEKRPTVERRMVEINQELMFCRKLLPSK